MSSLLLVICSEDVLLTYFLSYLLLVLGDCIISNNVSIELSSYDVVFSVLNCDDEVVKLFVGLL
jgi:hypothetical protein